MPNLKLGLIPDEKPVKLSVELPAGVHRDLIAYGEVLARETGQSSRANSLRRCSRDSCLRIAAFQRCDGRKSRRRAIRSRSLPTLRRLHTRRTQKPPEGGVVVLRRPHDA